MSFDPRAWLDVIKPSLEYVPEELAAELAGLEVRPGQSVSKDDPSLEC